MKITVKQLRSLIREVVEETLSGVEEGEAIDQDKDGDNDFDDVKIARMKASGMSHKNAVNKVHGKK